MLKDLCALIVILVLVIPSLALATSYYVDYDVGSDSNNGLTKNSPWKLAPGMTGFTGAYSHQQGDRFIFKGGVTWPNHVFPMRIEYGGNADSPDYYGVDQNWYAGSSWSRPIFDAQNNAIHQFIIVSEDYVTIDNFDMKNFYWDGSSGGYGTSYIIIGVQRYISINNSYFHSWSHGSGAADDLQVILGNGNGDGVGDVIENSIFDGAPNGTDSGMAVYVLPAIIRNCTVRNMSNGFVIGTGYVPTPMEVSNSRIGPITDSFDLGAHENAIESLGSGNMTIFNNIIFDTLGMNIFFGNPGDTAFIFNNVIYNSRPIPISLDVRGAIIPKAYIYNNIIHAAYDGYTCIAYSGIVDAQNNFCISEWGVGPSDNPTNLWKTHEEAKALGFIVNWTKGICWEDPRCYIITPNNLFAPTNASPTVNAGTSMSAIASAFGLPELLYDINGTPRPQGPSWDIGAYEYAGAPTQTCSSLGGACCSSGQTCSGSFLPSTDCGSMCCTGGTCQTHACGDHSCNGAETCSSCPQDCLSAGQVCCSGQVYSGNCCSSQDCFSPKTCISNICSTPSAGLIAAYSFNKGSGTALTDYSGNGNTGTISGAAWTTSGKYGNALSFDGVNDYVDVGSSPSINFGANSPFTFEGWVKTTESYGAIIAQRSSVETGAALDIMLGYDGAVTNAGKLMALVRQNSGSVGYARVTGGTINDGNWHHFVLTRNSGSTIELFLDGISQGTNSGSESGGAITTNLRALGSERRWVQDGYGTADQRYLNGTIDEVRVYNRSLSQAEILSDMNSPVSQCHRSDTNCDSCISMPELTAFIDRWKVSNVDVTIREVIEAISLWKKGCV